MFSHFNDASRELGDTVSGRRRSEKAGEFSPLRAPWQDFTRAAGLQLLSQRATPDGLSGENTVLALC